MNAPLMFDRNKNLADYQHELIMNSIIELEKSLDDSHEVAVIFPSFTPSLVLNLTKLRHSNPFLIHFCGTIDGKYAELIQHTYLLNFVLTVVEKSVPNCPAHRVDFGIVYDEGIVFDEH